MYLYNDPCGHTRSGLLLELHNLYETQNVRILISDGRNEFRYKYDYTIDLPGNDDEHFRVLFFFFFS